MTFYQKCFLSFFLLFFLHADTLAQTSTDPLYIEQWYMEEIDAPAAWDASTGSRDVIVAVLDTGFDLDHPDLTDNVWINTAEIPSDGKDNDQNGFVDDVNGYDFVENDGSPTPTEQTAFDEDAVSHGTIIAGIIGAVGENNEGIVGVNWEIQMMSVRILDNQGIGDSFLAAQGIEYAIQNGADIINLSFTGFENDERLQTAVQHAYKSGVVIVAAVGNQEGGGLNVNETPIYPACYGNDANEDWAIGVASSNEAHEKSSFSNYGSTCTDLTAPGENIFSTVYQSDDWIPFRQFYYLDGWSGTSMAAPMVTGAAALVKSLHPDFSPKEIKSILQLSVDPFSVSGEAKGQMGAGRLNVGKAVEVALAFVDDEIVAATDETTDRSPNYRIAVSQEEGKPEVKIFTNAGLWLKSFYAYDESFLGGVRLAMGDVNGDGEEEIVTAPGAGGGPQVRIFTLDGRLINQFFAFKGDMQAGLFVAVGDTDGDGIEEIAVATDTNGGGEVRLFNWQGAMMGSFNPFGSGMNGSLRVALGDVDRDGADEIITGRGKGYAPEVRVYRNWELVDQFFVYAETYTNGIFVASGDLDGDGDEEIVTGTDQGGGPHVQIFDGQGSWLGTFFAYDPLFRGGVRLSVGHLSDWKGASIITAAGPGGGPHIRVFNGYAKLIGTFFSGDENDRGGINSGAWGL